MEADLCKMLGGYGRSRDGNPLENDDDRGGGSDKDVGSHRQRPV